MEIAENKIKILSLEMPEGMELNNDLDDETNDDLTDPHKALAEIKFDEFIQQEKALKLINELSVKEKLSSTKLGKKSKEANKDENGLKSKVKKKKKTKDEDGKEHKKSSKKSKKIKKDNNDDNENAMEGNCLTFN